ncbi:MAG TPA: EamA family transporter, partial [Acidimicrobiales bacterium]
LALLPATEVGILGYLEPVGVVLFAWLLAGDAPEATTVAGGALVVAAGAITILTGPAARSTAEVTARVPG